MRRVIRLITFFVVFFVFYFILRTKAVNEWIVNCVAFLGNYVEIEKLSMTNAVQIVLTILAAILAFLFNILKLLVERAFKNKTESPCLFLHVTGPIEVSAVKKQRRKNTLSIEIGKQSARFRYITICLKNTGHSEMNFCAINSRHVKTCLKPSEEEELSILVFEPETKLERVLRVFTLTYSFLDNGTKKYKGKFLLVIILYKKTRKAFIFQDLKEKER